MAGGVVCVTSIGQPSGKARWLMLGDGNLVQSFKFLKLGACGGAALDAEVIGDTDDASPLDWGGSTTP